MNLSLEANQKSSRWTLVKLPPNEKFPLAQFLEGVGEGGKGTRSLGHRRIRRLEIFVKHDLNPQYMELYDQLMETANSEWVSIEEQEKVITLLCRRIATLEQDNLDCERTMLEKDHSISEIA